jgi:hypothetical protein
MGNPSLNAISLGRSRHVPIVQTITIATKASVERTKSGRCAHVGFASEKCQIYNNPRFPSVLDSHRAKHLKLAGNILDCISQMVQGIVFLTLDSHSSSSFVCLSITEELLYHSIQNYTLACVRHTFSSKGRHSHVEKRSTIFICDRDLDVHG